MACHYLEPSQAIRLALARFRRADTDIPTTVLPLDKCGHNRLELTTREDALITLAADQLVVYRQWFYSIFLRILSIHPHEDFREHLLILLNWRELAFLHKGGPCTEA